MSQTTQEKSNTNKGITTIVTLWIDNTSIAFATNYSVDILHLGSNIHLTYCSSCIFATMLLRYIAKRTSRRKVANRVTRSFAQYIICNAYQCIFLAKHLAILTDESQSVNVRIHNDTHIVSTLLQFIHDTTKVLL